MRLSSYLLSAQTILSEYKGDIPITQFTAYASVKRSIEKYAKGIGLVEQEFVLWEYQFDNARGTGAKTGFGVKRTMVDHN